MTESKTPAYAGQLPPTGAYDYDAFLSYSRADAPVAEGIQKGLHKVGRKMGRLHALRVFRDKTDLTASSSLWDKIRGALDCSRYLVVVLSPNSASSEWVNKEVDYWLTHRGRDNLLLVLADGTVVWDGTNGRFDPSASTAALPALAEPDALGDEPIYIDVSEDDPWDTGNPVFRDKVTDIAAPIHGKTKYELASDDLRERRRFRRFRRIAIAAVVLLAVLTTVAATLAFTQRREAIQQRNEAVASRLVSDAEAILRKMRGGGDDRALQQLATAYRISPGTGQGGLLTGLQDTVNTAKIIRTPEPVSTVALSPDGSRIISAGGDSPVVRIFDAQTGAKLNESELDTANVESMAISADGRRLVTGGREKVVHVWDVETGEPIGAPLTGSRSVVNLVAISPAADRVAAVHNDKSITVWNIDGGPKTAKTLAAPDGFVNNIAFSPDGRRLFARTSPPIDIPVDIDSIKPTFDVIVSWDTETGEHVGAPVETADPLGESFALSPDGRRIASYASARLESGIQQWDSETGQPIGPIFDGDTGIIKAITYSPDGQRVAGATADGTIRLWSAEYGDAIGAPMTGHDNLVTQMVFSPDGRRLVSGSVDGTIRIWDIKKPYLGSTMHLGDFAETALSPDTRLFAGVTREKPPLVAIGDNIDQTEGPVWELRPDDEVNSMAFSPDNRLLAIAAGGGFSSEEPTIRVWDVDTAEMLADIVNPHANSVSALTFSPDGTRIASAEHHPKPVVKVWDAVTGDQIGPDLTGAHGSLHVVAFSPGGRQVVSGGLDHQVYIWNIDSGNPVGTLDGSESGIHSVAFSPDGRLIATGDENTMRLWDAHTHEPISTSPTAQDSSVDSLVFSPDGQLLASGSNRGPVRVWDPRTGQQIGTPLAEESEDNSTLGFSPDGRRLVSTSSTGKLSTWPGPAQWPELVCSKLSANMSRKDWNRWVSPDIDYIPACPDLPIPEDA